MLKRLDIIALLGIYHTAELYLLTGTVECAVGKHTGLGADFGIRLETIVRIHKGEDRQENILAHLGTEIFPLQLVENKTVARLLLDTSPQSRLRVPVSTRHVGIFKRACTTERLTRHSVDERQPYARHVITLIAEEKRGDATAWNNGEIADFTILTYLYAIDSGLRNAERKGVRGFCIFGNLMLRNLDSLPQYHPAAGAQTPEGLLVIEHRRQDIPPLDVRQQIKAHLGTLHIA